MAYPKAGDLQAATSTRLRVNPGPEYSQDELETMARQRTRALAVYREYTASGMARRLWVHAYATGADLFNSSIATVADLDDASPETPKAANKAAAALLELYELQNHDIVELFFLAMTADWEEDFDPGEAPTTAWVVHTGRPSWHQQKAGHTSSSSTQFQDEDKANKYLARYKETHPDDPAFIVPVREGLSLTSKLSIAYDFGYALASMSIGMRGNNWFDDHKKFGLAVPGFNVSYDGHDLIWSGDMRKVSSRQDVREVSGRLGRITIVNPGDSSWTRHSYVMAFGAYGDTILMAYANSLDDALDECIDWLVENAPGHIVDEQVQEEYEHGIAEGLSEEEAMEQAEVDTTSGGNAGNRINSGEWTIVAEDPSEELLAEISKRR